MAFDEQAWIRETSSDPIEVNVTDSVKDLLSGYDYNVIIVTNTASKCGFTPQYEGLQNLFDKYYQRGLQVVAQPANNFANQEPENDANIKTFCETNYGVNFPLLPKADVIGDTTTELFKALAEATGQPPKWNFHKYIITGDKIYSRSHFQQIDEDFVNWIEGLL
jgi:glutathione peroxidase